MNVAFVHYHLRRGGVSRVMAMAARALTAEGVRVAVLVGEPPPDPHGLEETGAAVHVLPGLGYAPDGPESGGADLALSLRRTARELFGAPADIWHVHNHALGKNAALPVAVHALVEAGERLLLQIHDFSEDGRSSNYRLLEERLGGEKTAKPVREARLAGRLYPLAPRVHYAALNRRDHSFLADAGVPGAQLHLLANPVDVGRHTPLPPPPVSDGGLFLYPTRAIRRKNIGELLLWAALARDGERFATTLAPENPRELPVYERWVALASELDLPVDFAIGAGDPRPFAEVVAPARAFVTTSVAEGFGLAFLEPWILGRPLYGRDLPEITRDFSGVGIDLSMLYERCLVPEDWFDLDALRSQIGEALEASWAAYGRAVPTDGASRALEADGARGQIDFARLDEPRQEQVIRRAVESPAAVSELGLEPLARPLPEPDIVHRNAECVRESFALDAYGRRLAGIYRALEDAEHGPVEALETERLLDSFLSPERFRLLRT